MKKIFALLILIGIFGGGFFLWWQYGTTSVNKNDKSQKIFVVQKGAGIRAIANELKKEQLIKDPIVFFLLVKQLNLDNKIQAGDFRLSPSMTAKEIAEGLTHGTLDIWVTVPEGKRAEEIAEILKKNIPSYNDSWTMELKQHEGYLFPDTYLIPKDATIETIISLLTNTFYTKVKGIGLSKDDPTLSKIVTIASLIEREAITDSEKPFIAGIIVNRLEEDMALQVDATIQYAKGKRGNSWWVPVTVEEYKSVKSNYNTYLAPGLPPTPIANPGLEAIRAAKNPADVPYLYYL